MTLSHGQNISFMPMDITSVALLHIGLSPTDSFDEAIADMIVGGVEDFFQALIKVHMEKEEAKKVPNKHNFFCFLFFIIFITFHYRSQYLVHILPSDVFCLPVPSDLSHLFLLPSQLAPIVLLSALSFPFLVWSTNFLITLPLPYFFRWCYH